MVSKNPPQLLKITFSAAFRCAQAWLMEKPAAWVGRDARSGGGKIRLGDFSLPGEALTGLEAIRSVSDLGVKVF